MGPKEFYEKLIKLLEEDPGIHPLEIAEKLGISNEIMERGTKGLLRDMFNDPNQKSDDDRQLPAPGMDRPAI